MHKRKAKKMKENNSISCLQHIHLVGPDVEVSYEINKQLHLYQMLYNLRFIYPEHKASTSGGFPQVYSHLINIVSKEYYCDVNNHKSNEVPITTCSNGSCTFGFAKGKPFITATITCWGRLCVASATLSMKIHNPADGTYENVPFKEPEFYPNPEIIKTMMKYNKGFGAPKVMNENELKISKIFNF